jgi:hypothetical protein
MLQVTCGGLLYWADGKWYARLDEQNVIGLRSGTTAAAMSIDRAQSFTAPGPRIKAVFKMDLAEGFSNPTLRLRSSVDGADLTTDTETGLTFGDGQFVTFDLSGYRLTTGDTYYLVMLATTGVTLYMNTAGGYTGGSCWKKDPAWAQQASYDFWFQVHFADHEIRDALTAVAPEIPMLASGGKSSLSFSRSREEAPNVVEISFYDQTDWIVKPVRYEALEVQNGTKQSRTLSLQALAVPSSACAFRLARQWYKLAQRTNRVGCLVPQHGAIIAPVDVVALTSGIGPLTAVWYRVRSIERRLGCFDLELVEYNWDDYSTEDTTTLDAATIPNSTSSMQFVVLNDDFTSGTATDYDIGELGWHWLNATITYSASELNHPGILRFCGASSTSGAITLDGAAFLAGDVWASQWIFRPNVVPANTSVHVQDSFKVAVVNVGGTLTLYIDNVTTGKTCVVTDWIMVKNSGNGTTNYCNVFKNGTLWHQTNKAAIGGSFSAGASFSSPDYSYIEIDLARLTVGTER